MESGGKFARTARRHAVVIRIIVIGIMVLALLIPLMMVKALVGEREQRRDAAQAEIIGAWGGQQTLAGPILTIPFVTRIPDANGKLVESVQFAHFLPDSLRIEGEVTPETRKRGIYEATLYTAALQVSGVFGKPDFSGWQVGAKDILWDNAVLSVELPDMRAILDRITLSWGNTSSSFRPGKGTAGIFGGEIEAPVAAARIASSIPFSFPLRLHGGGSIAFLPLGDETTVRVKSPWRSPSFSGSYLPASRSIGSDGFQAEWKVISMARAYPQRWRQGETEPGSLLSSGFGVDFMAPVDTYLKVTRALKYGILFLLLPFGTLFLLEVFSGRRLHPLHYLLVGLANCVFYLLLLSLSEHIPFDAAYAAASVASAALVTVYTLSIMKSWREGIAILPVLAAGYGFLALVLRSEDFALLVGALGLFLILAAVMMLTRKVDWYGMGFSRRKGALQKEDAPAGD
jgi:inner membrane protein